jgi:hypothetical protein
MSRVFKPNIDFPPNPERQLFGHEDPMTKEDRFVNIMRDNHSETLPIRPQGLEKFVHLLSRVSVQ